MRWRPEAVVQVYTSLGLNAEELGRALSALEDLCTPVLTERQRYLDQVDMLLLQGPALTPWHLAIQGGWVNAEN